MKPSQIARLNLRRTPWATFTGISALALSLAVAGWVFSYQNALMSGLDKVEPGIEYIMGPKSSGLSVFLDGVFMAGRNDDIFDYMVLDTMERKLEGATVIPLAHFATFDYFPVVGTNASYWHRPATLPAPKLAEGRWFAERGGEAVIGYEVARRKGMTVGDSLEGEYRTIDGRTVPLRVTGILQQSGYPRDRAIFTHIIHAWIYHHQAIGQGYLRRVGEHRGATAFLVALAPDKPAQADVLYSMIHVNSSPQLIHVSTEIANLRQLLGRGESGLWGVSALLYFLAGGVAFLFFCERGEMLKMEMGIFRALGYSRVYVGAILLWEGVYVAVAGMLMGLVLVAVLMTGTRLLWNPHWFFHPPLYSGILLYLCLAMVLAGILSSMLALTRLYSWDAHTALKGM